MLNTISSHDDNSALHPIDDVNVASPGLITRYVSGYGAVQRKKEIQKSEITMEVGGWVHVSLGIFFSTDILE